MEYIIIFCLGIIIGDLTKDWRLMNEKRMDRWGKKLASKLLK